MRTVLSLRELRCSMTRLGVIAAILSWSEIRPAEAIRDCDTEYYDIVGDDGSQLLEALREKNGTKGGYFAHTAYKYRNTCASLKTTCKVRLPRWTGFSQSKNEALKSKWAKFLDALIEHEQGHVDIFNKGMAEAEATAKETSCRAATLHYSRAFTKMNREQKSFDQRTDHGKKNGATFAGAHYLGIAYSPKKNVLGVAQNAESKELASKTAMAGCKAKDCKFVVWAHGEKSCVSLARGANGGYGYAYGEGQQEAENKAIAACNKYAEQCTVRKTVCADDDLN